MDGVLAQPRDRRLLDRRHDVQLLKENKENLEKAGVPDFGFSVTENHEAFSAALKTMRRENRDGGPVDPKSPQELEGTITFMNTDGTAGGAVQPNGNVVTKSLKSPNSTAVKFYAEFYFEQVRKSYWQWV